MILKKKGQVDEVLVKVMMIIMSGIALYWSMPILSDLRLGVINNPNAGILIKLLFYLMIPAIWLIFFFAIYLFLRSSGDPSEV